MKKKNILFLFVLVLLMIPNITNALTFEEAYGKAQEKIDRIPATKNEDGTCTWNIKMIDLEILKENTCNYTKETIIEKYPYWANLSEEELEQNLNDHNYYCKENILGMVFENASIAAGNQRWDIGVTPEDYKDNQVTIHANYEYETDVEYNYGYGEISKTCYIEFEKTNEQQINKAIKVTSAFQENYQIKGLNSFNSVYHYGHLFEDAFNDKLMLYRFPEFKKVIMKNPEYDYQIAWEGAGGTPYMNGSGGYITLYKNGVAYAMKHVGFGIYNEFYVDKNAPGTPLEKAEARLKEYFGEKVLVEIDKENVTYYDEEDLKGYYTTVKLGKHQSEIFIIETDEKDLDKYNVEAYHKKTGVGVDSNSYDVPLDATLDVENVKDEEYVKKAFSNGMFTLTDAYDISVIKTANGALVDFIENGIEVYIPVENRKVGQKVNIHHITEDGKLGEKYQAIVVEKDGILYAKFTTTHFSTYAVSDITTVDVENPETLDDVTTSLLMGTIAIVSLLSVSFIFVKRNNNFN